MFCDVIVVWLPSSWMSVASPKRRAYHPSLFTSVGRQLSDRRPTNGRQLAFNPQTANSGPTIFSGAVHSQSSIDVMMIWAKRLCNTKCFRFFFSRDFQHSESLKHNIYSIKNVFYSSSQALQSLLRGNTSQLPGISCKLHLTTVNALRFVPRSQRFFLTYHRMHEWAAREPRSDSCSPLRGSLVTLSCVRWKINKYFWDKSKRFVTDTAITYSATPG